MTQNSWNSDVPVTVDNGGTGRGSHTVYAVLCGGTTTTGPQQSVASVGTSGQVLTSNGAGSLPTFQTGGGGVSGPGSSTDNALSRWDGTGGDTLQDSTVIVTDDGEMTNGSQPAFHAYLGTGDTNVTGNGTLFTLGSGNALTEVFDQNGDFVTTGTFTAPVSGLYLFHLQMRVGGTVVSDNGNIRIVTSNNQFIGGAQDVVSVKSSGSGWVPFFSVFADMDASDTTTFAVIVTGEASDVADIDAGQGFTWCSGCLIC